MKGHYRCRKCKMEVMSKCINNRSIFPIGEAGSPADIANMLGTRMDVRVKDNEPLPEDHWNKKLAGKVVKRTVTIEIDAWCIGEDDRAKSHEQVAFEEITQLVKHFEFQPEAFKILICDHDWEVLSPCMFDCCKPEPVKIKARFGDPWLTREEERKQND